MPCCFLAMNKMRTLVAPIARPKSDSPGSASGPIFGNDRFRVAGDRGYYSLHAAAFVAEMAEML